ncbi:DUF1653 domain-containing protein [Acetobacter sp. AN02]|uniref:DUF1653 domain-containing protein n=1 Tax=Acetobacter sp. AN02 TaxID=2894186 RepID=UPI0024342B5F|nr:DUF1653 domain-containing protein [Acetobacter sp. AN02]MDG6094068.1 DUF1653 domain-containing protein [Acetobacter sp. AN02]
MTDSSLPSPGLYRHYKGGFYTLISVVRHSETEEPLVTYRSEEKGTLWARPLSMWVEEVDGRPRFARVSGAETGVTRFSSGLITLHWLSAPLVIAVIILGWVGATMPDANPGGFTSHRTLMMFHKSFGLLVLAFTFVRIGVRFSSPRPSAKDGPVFFPAISGFVHLLLYVVLLVMPLSGYVLAANGRSLRLFDVIPLPSFSGSDALGDMARQVHSTAQWMLYLLLALHIGGAAWHVFFRKDGRLMRILPAQKKAGIISDRYI